jgi:hypothetical protein
MACEQRQLSKWRTYCEPRGDLLLVDGDGYACRSKVQWQARAQAGD